MKLGGIQKKLKVILLIVLLLGGLGVSIFAGSKVSGLFMNSAKASQCPAQNIKTTQVTANSAVIGWETADKTIGKISYGTESKSLTFSAIEKSSENSHTMPLTLLTPSTKYFYTVSIGDKMCDSSGQTCDVEKGNCVPWTFTTQTVSPPGEVVAPLETVTPIDLPTSVPPTIPATPSATASGTPKVSGGPSPTSSMSAFCQELAKNVGESSADASKWATVKQYDLDNNGIINGHDVTSCPSTGK